MNFTKEEIELALSSCLPLNNDAKIDVSSGHFFVQHSPKSFTEEFMDCLDYVYKQRSCTNCETGTVKVRLAVAVNEHGDYSISPFNNQDINASDEDNIKMAVSDLEEHTNYLSKRITFIEADVPLPAKTKIETVRAKLSGQS